MIRTLAAAALLLATAGVAAADGTTEIAVVVYRATDVECHDARYTAELTDAQLAEIGSEIADFEAKAEVWTQTDVVVTVEQRDLLTSVTPTGRGFDCWPTAADTNPPTTFDGVLVVWHPGDCSADVLPSCVSHRAGTAHVGTTLGFSYGTATGNVGSAWQTSKLSDVLMHEYLHGYMPGEPPTEFPPQAAPATPAPTAAPSVAPPQAPVAPVPSQPAMLPDTATAP